MRQETFLAAGGAGARQFGEGRALVQALRRTGGRIRHAPEVSVFMPDRRAGCAAYARPEAILRHGARRDALADAALEPVADRVRRLGARRMLREAWVNTRDRPLLLRHLSGRLGLSVSQLDGWLGLPHFGAVWDLVEAASPVMFPRPVPRSELSSQSAAASAVLASLADARALNH